MLKNLPVGEAGRFVFEARIQYFYQTVSEVYEHEHMKGKPWNRRELVYALSLYFQIPFGRLNQNNPVIIRAAKVVGRTPAAVSMKLCNFARFDPAHKARQIKGLRPCPREGGERRKNGRGDLGQILWQLGAAG